MLRGVIIAVVVLSGIHGFLGLVSICVGVIASIQAEVWLAHRVAPIWSGAFFIITAILGILCARQKTTYLIMCFAAALVVSIVIVIISIQLLRLGLVNHTTDGHTFRKKNMDALVIIALTTAGIECLVCLISFVFGFRLARAVKKETFKQREGMFHVKVLGQKDIMVVTKPLTDTSGRKSGR